MQTMSILPRTEWLLVRSDQHCLMLSTATFTLLDMIQFMGDWDSGVFFSLSLSVSICSKVARRISLISLLSPLNRLLQNSICPQIKVFNCEPVFGFVCEGLPLAI